jgi:hypothetical protein
VTPFSLRLTATGSRGHPPDPLSGPRDARTRAAPAQFPALRNAIGTWMSLAKIAHQPRPAPTAGPAPLKSVGSPVQCLPPAVQPALPQLSGGLIHAVGQLGPIGWWSKEQVTDPHDSHSSCKRPSSCFQNLATSSSTTSTWTVSSGECPSVNSTEEVSANQSTASSSVIWVW